MHDDTFQFHAACALRFSVQGKSLLARAHRYRDVLPEPAAHSALVAPGCHTVPALRQSTLPRRTRCTYTPLDTQTRPSHNAERTAMHRDRRTLHAVPNLHSIRGGHQRPKHTSARAFSRHLIHLVTTGERPHAALAAALSLPSMRASCCSSIHEASTCL